MSYIPLYKNADRDANLVEMKARILPDYSILSTDTKPTLASADAGRILEEADTGDRFRWTGTQWIQTHDAAEQIVLIDDSIPVEVNVQQPVSVDDNAASLTIDTDEGEIQAEIVGSSKSKADVSRYGQLVTGMRGDDVLVRFEYNNSTEDVEEAVAGTGAVANADAMASTSPGTGVGTAAISSLRFVTYRPGHEIYSFFTTLYAAPEANTYQRHGIFNGNNGFFFGYEGTTFGVSIRKDGTDTQTAQASWNVDACDGAGSSGFDLNHEALLQYKITYGWLGSAPISFWIYGGVEYDWILVHVIDQTNTSTSPSVSEPSQGIKIESGRTTGTGAAILTKTSSWAAGTIEGVHTHAGHRIFAGAATTTLASATETLMAAFRNKSTFQGRTNKVTIEAVYMGAATDGNKSVLINFYRNATITGGAWADVDTNNSVTEVNTTATYSGGKYEMTVPLSKVDSVSIDLGGGHIHLELFPGESMVVAGLSANANEVVLSFRWEEYFS